MDVLKLFDWDQTAEAIRKLEKLLECSICKKVSEDPQCLGRCDHFYCRECVGDVSTGMCPMCKLPSPPCEMKPDRIISGLVASTKDLKCLFGGREVQGIVEGIEAPPHTPPSNTMARGRTNKKPLQDIATRKPENVTKTKAKLAKQKALGEPKPKKKAKVVQGSTSGQRLEELGVQAISDAPATPENKKLLKAVDLSALGMSPSTPGINKRNSKGETTLHVACVKGDAAKVQSLLADGANPNTKDNAGWTPLHEACSHGFLDIAKDLLQHGAIVDVPGGSNEIPLHDAVTQGMVDLIKLLRSWGASDTARNLQGHTPRSIASFCNGAEELLSALDTPVDTSVPRPPVQLPLQNKIQLMGSGLSGPVMAKNLENLSKLFRARIVMDFSMDVTHLVAECGGEGYVCQRTLKYMMGVAAGKWIVSHKWMEECVEKELALNPEPYEVSGSYHNAHSNAPKLSRLNASKMRPALFNGCHMYLWGNFKEPGPNKKDVEKLIKAGGGIVLAREPNPEAIPDNEQTVPYHSTLDGPLARCSHYIIYHEGTTEPQLKYDMAHLKTLPLAWLMDCVDHFSLVAPTSTLDRLNATI